MTLTNPHATLCDGIKRFKPKNRYAFDFVFDQQAGHREIYEKTMPRYVDAVMKSQNATVFAYGVTGSGKTHTLNGPKGKHREGLICMAISHLFDQIRLKTETNEVSYQVVMSYYQIYNEQIQDLLLRKPACTIEVLEDPVRGTVVSGVANVSVNNCEEILELIELGMTNRVTESTE
jgi:primosomal protein N'